MGISRIPDESTGEDRLIPTGLADALFTTTQQRVLGLLYGQPRRSFPITEIIRLADSGSGAVQRELARLAAAGLVTLRQDGRLRLYQANPDSPIRAELSRIILKTINYAEPIRDALQPFANRISVAFVFGSVAKRRESAASDIDLLVVSDTLGSADLRQPLAAAEKKLARDIKPGIYATDELRRRLAAGNAFVQRMVDQPKRFVIGGAAELDQALGRGEPVSGASP